MFKFGKNITADIQLVQKEKCTKAFSRLMGENLDIVRRVIYRIVSNEHDTDDIVQETFIKAFNKISKFEGKAKFSTWLCRIAYNEALMFLRKKDKVLIFEEPVKFNTKVSTESADSAIKTEEAQGDIQMAIDKLSSEQKAALTLTAIEGKSVKEAAYILDCNQMTLYWRLQQTRKLLSKQLNHLLQ